MINKILNITNSMIMDTIHGETDRNKKNFHNPKHEHQNNSNELSEVASEQECDLAPNYSTDDLVIWIKELNEFQCYQSIDLKFILDEQFEKTIILLKDKKGHNLQEYLPLQIKAIHSQVKNDLAEIPKGTILNINC